MKKYCSFCGEKFPSNYTLPYKCSCENFNWANPIPCVAVIVPLDNQMVFNDGVLLVRRNIEPKLGGLSLPGGYMDMNETFEECATRELFEETGLTIASNCFGYVGNKISVSGNIIIFMEYHFGLSESFVRETFAPNNEVSELVVLNKNNMTKIDICFQTHDEAIKEFFKRTE